MTGKFQLLVKNYPGGNVSSFIHNMAVGQNLRFKHIKFNIKEQYPFGKKSISMITGGTGITPMLQALHMLLTTTGDDTKIVMLDGNRSMEDVLMKEMLHGYAQKFKDRFTFINVVGSSPDDKPIGWDRVPENANYVAETGWIDEEKVKKYCFPPSADTSVFICGLPVLYTTMCGPRSEKEVAAGTVLSKLGYTSEMVCKF
jgi:NAD(P)H-flavin reductase